MKHLFALLAIMLALLPAPAAIITGPNSGGVGFTVMQTNIITIVGTNMPTYQEVTNITQTIVSSSGLFATDTGSNYLVNADKPVDFGTNLSFTANAPLFYNGQAGWTNAFCSPTNNVPPGFYWTNNTVLASNYFDFVVALPQTRSTNPLQVFAYITTPVPSNGVVVHSMGWTLLNTNVSLGAPTFTTKLFTNALTKSNTGYRGYPITFTLDTTALILNSTNSDRLMVVRMARDTNGNTLNADIFMANQPQLKWTQTMP